MRGLTLAALPLLGGCLWASGGVETFDWRIEPVASVTPVAVQAAERPPSATEVRYARDTARTVFRRRQVERTPDFVRHGPDGYAMCLRAGSDYALLVFERRVFEEAISQAADDARVLRAGADTAPCRARGLRWIAV